MKNPRLSRKNFVAVVMRHFLVIFYLVLVVILNGIFRGMLCLFWHRIGI